MRHWLFFIILLHSQLALSSSGESQDLLSKKSYIEKSPIIDDVELVQGDPFLEVFIVGKAEKGCYSEHEYHIEKLEKVTIIVPRFRTTNTEKRCESKLESFREKAADLDVNANSTELIRVLGNFGWIERRFNRNMLPLKQE